MTQQLDPAILSYAPQAVNRRRMSLWAVASVLIMPMAFGLGVLISDYASGPMRLAWSNAQFIGFACFALGAVTGLVVAIIALRKIGRRRDIGGGALATLALVMNAVAMFVAGYIVVANPTWTKG